MNTIALASFNDREKAELLKKRLEEAGIKAHVYDESRRHKYLFLSEALAAEKVEVHEKDFNRARVLLEQLDISEDALHFAVCCPQCHSPRVEYPQSFTRKFTLPALVDIATTKTGLIEKYFYCLDCHYTWPKEERVEPETDILNWPREHKGILPY
jgi:hypothetical protein